MKKLIIATTIAAATFASIGTASALDSIFLKGYQGWAQQALSAPSR